MITTANTHKNLIKREITFVDSFRCGRNYPYWPMAQIGADGVVCRITITITIFILFFTIFRANVGCANVSSWSST